MAVQEFISPTSLSEAQQAVSDGAVSSWLAGGTDLLVGIRLGARDPARVIDLKQIPELTAIEIDETSVRIGAAASAFDVLHNSDVPSLFPGLAEALDLIGSTQIHRPLLGRRQSLQCLACGRQYSGAHCQWCPVPHSGARWRTHASGRGFCGWTQPECTGAGRIIG